MFKKILSAVIALTLVMGMCSCSEQSSNGTPTSQPGSSLTSQPGSEPVEPSPVTGRDTVELTANYTFTPTVSQGKDNAEFIKGLNGFSVELFKNSVKSYLTDGKNTLVSPESVAFALGMTANGADGNTLKQMQDVICGGMDIDTFNKNMNLLISNAHRNNTDDSKLSIANSIWVKDAETLKPTEQFTKNCKEMYNAEMFRAPFDAKTVDALNGWVNEKTDKMIPKLIDNFQGSEIMCLVNCIAFDSKWENEYNEDQVIQDQKFTNAKGQEVECTMLSGTESIYVENSKVSGFIKNYKGGKYAFMALLPTEGTIITDYVASMTKDEISGLYENRTNKYDVFTKLPKFSYDHSTEMAGTLRQMGIKDAFENADFSKMFEDVREASINRVIHKTHIELDAKGTKAAASTAVIMKESAVMTTKESKTVVLDRPFVYAIIDTETGLPVFMGTVCDPSVQ